MPIDLEQIQATTAHGKVFTESGEKVGDVGQVYLDDTHGTPTWVTVKTGLFGTAESFVPLEGARVEGENLVVAFDKETIKDAPRVEADGSITPEEEQGLFRHYGLQSPADRAGQPEDSARSDRADSGRLATDEVSRDGVRDDRDDVHTSDRVTDGDRTDDDRTDRVPTATDAASIGAATDAPAAAGTGSDDAMTRSEEQLNVSTQTHVAGRAVLRKHVVTEYVTQTVPVRREEVRLERVPISDGELGDLVDDAVPFGDDTDLYEVILHQEVPVVQTETVAVERVRLRKETRTDEATVSDEVRKEKLDLDDPRAEDRD